MSNSKQNQELLCVQVTPAEEEALQLMRKPAFWENLELIQELAIFHTQIPLDDGEKYALMELNLFRKLIRT